MVRIVLRTETTPRRGTANKSSMRNIRSFSAMAVGLHACESRDISYPPRGSNCTKLYGGQGPPSLKAISSSICAAEAWMAASN